MSSPRAFTLAELLAAVTIVAALAALAAPGLSQAIREAKQQKSLSNLHSIGVGVGLYLADNQGLFPLICSPTYTDPFWITSVSAYLPGKATYDSAGKVFTISTVLVDPLIGADYHHPLGDYGANSDLFAGPVDWPPTTAPVPLAALAGRQSKVVAVVTAATGQTAPFTGSWFIARSQTVNLAPAAWTSSMPNDRGLGEYLCLFADFHTEAIRKDDFVARRRDLMSLNP